jgi:hypothetical protein
MFAIFIRVCVSSQTCSFHTFIICLIKVVWNSHVKFSSWFVINEHARFIFFILRRIMFYFVTQTCTQLAAKSNFEFIPRSIGKYIQSKDKEIVAELFEKERKFNTPMIFYSKGRKRS